MEKLVLLSDGKILWAQGSGDGEVDNADLGGTSGGGTAVTQGGGGAPEAVVGGAAAEDAADSVDSGESNTEQISDGEDPLDSVVAFLPRLGVILLVAFVAWQLAGWFSDWMMKRSKGSGHSDRTQVWGHLLSWLIFGVAISLAIAWAVPSVSLGDLLSGLGFASVAIGFLFRDILENTLSGLILLYRRPFSVGDEVHFDTYQGRVIDIQIRATQIRQYNGEMVYIPNRDIYKGRFKVITDRDMRRIEFAVGVAYGDDLTVDTDMILEAVKTVDDIYLEPAPEAFTRELALSCINIEVRVWGPAYQDDFLRVQDQLIKAVKERFDAEGKSLFSNMVGLQSSNNFLGALQDDKISVSVNGDQGDR